MRSGHGPRLGAEMVVWQALIPNAEKPQPPMARDT